MPRLGAFFEGSAHASGAWQRLRWIRRAACAAVFASTLLITSVGLAEPIQPSPETDRAITDILRTAPDRASLSKLLGTGAERCVETSVRFIHCAWHLRNKHTGWSEIARVLKTRQRVAVICELPRDGSERALGSCVARPQESNRSMFVTASSPGPSSRKGVRRRNSADANASKEAYAAIAKNWLEGARTIAELTRLMGALPDSCERGMGLKDEQVCVWKTTKRTYGHGTVAASEMASLSKKMILRCVLPLDGSARDADSCLARIGS